MAGWTREDEAKEAMHDGKDARRQGLSIDANPNRPGTLGWSAWNDGWSLEDSFIRKAQREAA